MTDTEKLRELLAAATRGPWHVEADPGSTCAECGEDCDTEAALIRSTATTGGVALVMVDDRAQSNAALIVEAVNALPSILSDLDRLRAENAEMRKVVEQARTVAALGYETVHKGTGKPSEHDPDIYQLERVTAVGWWRFVHAVRDCNV